MDGSKSWHVYLMIDPRDGVVRKVGITTDLAKRSRHLVLSRKHKYNRHHAVVTDMHNEGVSPTLVSVGEFGSKSAAIRVERTVSIALRVAGVPIVNAEGELAASRLISSK